MKKSYIAFDTVLCRPACVNLQAAMGGDPHWAKMMPSETWLINITPDLKLYPMTDELLPVLIEKVEDNWRKRNDKR